MTRLCESDLAGQADDWGVYAARLRQTVGCGVVEVGARALELPPDAVRRARAAVRVGVVPVSSGEGCIPGFADLLAATARALGSAAVVLPPDAAGFAQARAGACDVLLWADDDTYLAEHVRSGHSAENGWATGRGFAAALCGMAERYGLERRALVLGAGPVGTSAAAWLAGHGFAVTLCDIVPDRAQTRAADIPHCRGITPRELDGLAPFPCLLDASPTEACFPLQHLAAGACISAPCVPCRWPACAPAPERVWHDPLQLGTAVMLAAAACGISGAISGGSAEGRRP